jgi:hypothetical protein
MMKYRNWTLPEDVKLDMAVIIDLIPRQLTKPLSWHLSIPICAVCGE